MGAEVRVVGMGRERRDPESFRAPDSAAESALEGIRAEDGGRHWLKGHTRHRQVQFLAARHGLFQQAAVPTVYAVKGADGDDALPRRQVLGRHGLWPYATFTHAELPSPAVTVTTFPGLQPAPASSAYPVPSQRPAAS